MINTLNSLSGYERITALLFIAVIAHVAARLVKYVGLHLSTSQRSDRAKTIFSLFVSVVVFTIYFVVLGIILKELGVPLSTYIASASVVGIAVGFGTQNLVQDVINGLTIILTDLFTVGDMVEISGQTGIVQNVTMRFVVLKNQMGAKVYIPTRTVTNVINYPRGYVRCLVDIRLPDREALQHFNETVLEKYAKNFQLQYPAIFIAQPAIEPIEETAFGQYFIRVKFRIWPARGGPIETIFKQDILEALQAIDETANPADVSVNYEIANTN